MAALPGRQSIINMWTGRGNIIRDLAFKEFLKVINEEAGQFLCHLIVGILIRPRIPRIEDRARHVGTGLRNGNVKHGHGRPTFFPQFIIKGCMDHGPRIGKLHPLANAVRTAAPPRIDQVHMVRDEQSVHQEFA